MSKNKFKFFITFLLVLVFITSSVATQSLSKSISSSKSSSKRLSSINLPVLTYHDIAPEGIPLVGATVSVLQFREDMLYLRAMGYNTIHFSELIRFVEGRGALPPNPIVITFDDGYRSNYSLAYPILKELKMKATISIIGWSVGSHFDKDGTSPIIPHFTWDEAFEMQSSGLIEIHHHTYDLHDSGSNPQYPRKGVSKLDGESSEEYINTLTQDFQQLKKLIKEHLNKDSLVFTYPFGLHTKEAEQVLKRLGFKVTLTTAEGINNLGDGLYLMKRIARRKSLTGPSLIRRLNELRGLSPSIPFSTEKSIKNRIKKLEQLIK